MNPARRRAHAHQLRREVLLDRLPHLRLADDQEIVPVVSATVRGTQSLRLVWG
jgi:hypothetical protein